MPIRPILRYPDPRLAVTAQAVTAFNDTLRDLATDLLDTMRAAPGIGITAPHVGIALRVVVLELDPTDGANLCQSGDRLDLIQHDHASRRQRLDAGHQ